jgi:hypothetical protein
MPYNVSFFDEASKTQIDGSYTTDGKFIHATSAALGYKSARVGHLGTFIDRAGNLQLAQKLLSELARDEAKNMNGHGH